MTPHSNRVNMRLTDLEKADWTAAAGGSRRLSEWIRATCNKEAERDRLSKQGPPPTEVSRGGDEQACQPTPGDTAVPGVTDPEARRPVPNEVEQARVVELADTAASSTVASGREGSTPSPSIVPNEVPSLVKLAMKDEQDASLSTPPSDALLAGAFGGPPANEIQVTNPKVKHPGTPSSAATAGAPKPRAATSRQKAKSSGGGAHAALGSRLGTSSSDQSCPRWTYHRKGTYCGSCKKVQ